MKENIGLVSLRAFIDKNINLLTTLGIFLASAIAIPNYVPGVLGFLISFLFLIASIFVLVELLEDLFIYNLKDIEGTRLRLSSSKPEVADIELALLNQQVINLYQHLQNYRSGLYA